MIDYHHRDALGHVIDLPVSKVLCIGQNYMDHIKELNSTQAPEPLFFFKPQTALCDVTKPLVIPLEHGECHNELEMAVLIKSPLKNADIETVKQHIWGYGLALDLTLRDVQKRLKSLGRPWEMAKSFDDSCPVSHFVPADDILDPQQLTFTLTVNGETRQCGATDHMMRPVYQLIAEMSSFFTLQAGDIVLTGTPAGVGPLVPGDKLTLSLDAKQRLIDIKTEVQPANG